MVGRIYNEKVGGFIVVGFTSQIVGIKRNTGFSSLLIKLQI